MSMTTFPVVRFLGGKPLKFQDVEEVRKTILDYFNSCWEELWLPVKDRDGLITEWRQQLNKDGSPVMHFKERPTITGLALALGTNKLTLLEYEKRDSEVGKLIKQAKATVEYCYEKASNEGDIHPAVGIFVLKNFGWTDVLQINNTSQPEQLSLAEIRTQLQDRKTLTKEDKPVLRRRKLG